jgi:hypothetical protein
MTRSYTIEKTSNNIWTAVIKYSGFPSVGQAFYTKKEAEEWVKNYG